MIGTVPESWLGVPLITESGDVNGVVAVQSYEKEAYSEKDAQVLSIIASNIAGLLTYKKTEDQIKASLKEKEVLLQEIHHRVKNNLQIITSMLRLQSDKTENKKVQEVFKGSQNRIKSMALIHEKLYQSLDFARVSFADYIKSLSNYLFSTYRVNTNVVRLRTEVKDAFLDINRAIPCGLIINELVSNSLKYAFIDGSKGEIFIKFHSNKAGKFTLVVSDNGVGFPRDLDIHKTQTLGLRLVTILTEQIRGSIKLDRKGGTTFKITF